MSITALVLTAALVPAQVPEAAQKQYADILAKYVKDGRVNYKGIQENAIKDLDAYVAAVGEAKVPADKNAALGFYVDAYNALVIKAVLANNRPRSVLDVKGFFDAAKHKVAGQEVTLDSLEKKVINPFAKDPRTHMVLVCGAVGCPILENKPYSGSDMNKRMDEATRRYLKGPTGAVIEAGSAKLSKIFDWYNADFGGPEGVLIFVKRHIDPALAEKLGASPKVSFIEYNWTLNQQ